MTAEGAWYHGITLAHAGYYTSQSAGICPPQIAHILGSDPSLRLIRGSVGRPDSTPQTASRLVEQF